MLSFLSILASMICIRLTTQPDLVINGWRYFRIMVIIMLSWTVLPLYNIYATLNEFVPVAHSVIITVIMLALYALYLRKEYIIKFAYAHRERATEMIDDLAFHCAMGDRPIYHGIIYPLQPDEVHMCFCNRDGACDSNRHRTCVHAQTDPLPCCINCTERVTECSGCALILPGRGGPVNEEILGHVVT